MNDPKKRSEPGGSDIQFLSDSDVIHIREEDTVPCKPSERLRRWLEEKYGRKRSSPEGPQEQANGA